MESLRPSSINKKSLIKKPVSQRKRSTFTNKSLNFAPLNNKNSQKYLNIKKMSIPKELNIMEVDKSSREELILLIFEYSKKNKNDPKFNLIGLKGMKVEGLKTAKDFADYDKFSNKVNSFIEKHKKCEPKCKHLMRFYASLGLIPKDQLSYCQIKKGISVKKYQVGIDNVNDNDFKSQEIIRQRYI